MRIDSTKERKTNNNIEQKHAKPLFDCFTGCLCEHNFTVCTVNISWEECERLLSASFIQKHYELSSYSPLDEPLN